MENIFNYRIRRDGGRYFVEKSSEPHEVNGWSAVYPSSYLDNTTAEWFTSLDEAKTFVVEKIMHQKLEPLPAIVWESKKEIL